MSAFIREFEAILAQENIRSGSKVFEIAGLDKSMLSRIRAGARIQFDEIPRVAAAISSDESVFLRLLRARLIEECTDPRARRIEVSINGDHHYTLAETSTPYSTLPPKQATALANIVANLPTDAGLRNTILWLGNEVFAAEVSSSPSSAPSVKYPSLSAAAQGAVRQVKKDLARKKTAVKQQSASTTV